MFINIFREQLIPPPMAYFHPLSLASIQIDIP